MHYSCLSLRRTLRQTWAIVRRRCFAPTSATDSRYEHPQTVRFPEVQLSLSWSRAALNKIHSRNAIPDLLAVVRIPGGQAVDAAVQLWASHAQVYLEKGEPSTAPGDAAWPWRYQPRARLCELTSNVPCHISRNSVTRMLRNTRAAAFVRSSKTDELEQPGTSSTDKCSRGSPPLCPRFSHRWVSFRRSFALTMLSHGKARPSTCPQALHLWARRPRAACRFLQPNRSATTTA